MGTALRATFVIAALIAACLIIGCGKKPEQPAALPAGSTATGAATAPGIPKQGSANAGMEAPVAAPSGAQTGNYAGGRK
jgi:hypothetical protein